MGEKWTTHDELEFLKRIRKENPAVYKGYRESIHHRQDWGDIDGSTIKEYLGLSGSGSSSKK